MQGHRVIVPLISGGKDRRKGTVLLVQLLQLSGKSHLTG